MLLISPWRRMCAHITCRCLASCTCLIDNHLHSSISSSPSYSSRHHLRLKERLFQFLILRFYGDEGKESPILWYLVSHNLTMQPSPVFVVSWGESVVTQTDPCFYRIIGVWPAHTWSLSLCASSPLLSSTPLTPFLSKQSSSPASLSPSLPPCLCAQK